MDTQTNQTLGQRLRTARLARGLLQKQLAAQSGVHAQMVGRIERDVTRAPSMSTISALAQALDIAPSWLLSDDPDAPRGP